MTALLCFTILAGCGGGPPASPTETPAETAASGAAAGPPRHPDPGPPPEGQTEPPVDAAPADGTAPVPASAQEVKLQLLDWAGVERLVAAHKGQVVVVDLWSTSCVPCRREFPNLVKLQRELGDKVACISVSADYDGIPSKPAETYREAVLEFLTSQGATFENVLSTVAAEELFDQLKIGSIPSVFVYDQSGQLVKRFTEPVDGTEFTYAGQIRPFVESLLASQ